MLQRDIDIIADFGFLPYNIEDFQGKTAGKGIVKANPINPIYLYQGPKQFGQGAFFYRGPGRSKSDPGQ